MKFYNRKKELELLETLYKNLPSFVVLTGKRRVGKTELIKRFSQGRRFLYLFVDSNKSRDILLSEYEEHIKEELGLPEYIRFTTPAELIQFLLDYEEELIVAFDEFQRFLKIDSTFITELQKQWDLKGGSSKVFLITSGSSIGMMKRIFIEEKAPLFKRADNIIALRPFSLKEIFEVLDDLGIKGLEEKLDIYCLFGGTIYYYRLMEKYGVKSFHDALDKLVLNELAPLRHEVRDILIEEFSREHATYYEILSAMSMGKATKKEIGDATHVSPSSLSPYLYDLIELLQIAEYVIPVTERSSRTKKGRYFLKDNFFRFYFRFIYRNMSHYLIGNYDIIKEKIALEWKDFKGRILEDVALEFARKTLSNNFPKIGRFWDRRGNEIDIVGINKKNSEVLLIEVKSRKLSHGDARSVLNNMQKKADLLSFPFKKAGYGIIAPVIEDRKKMEKEGCLIWTLEDLLRI
ncbi:MAG: ATP-binding protein [Candidatus Hydrothermarchaeales archaeon]